MSNPSNKGRGGRPRSKHGTFKRVGGGKGAPISLRLPATLDLALRDWLGISAPDDKAAANQTLRDWVTTAIAHQLKQEIAEYDDAADRASD